MCYTNDNIISIMSLFCGILFYRVSSNLTLLVFMPEIWIFPIWNVLQIQKHFKHFNQFLEFLLTKFSLKTEASLFKSSQHQMS